MVAGKNRMFRTPSGKLITVSDADKAGVSNNPNDLTKDDMEKLIAVASERLGYKVNAKTLQRDGTPQEFESLSLNAKSFLREIANDEFNGNVFSSSADKKLEARLNDPKLTANERRYISPLVNELKKQGVIQTVPGYRRKETRVELTEKGNEMIEELMNRLYMGENIYAEPSVVPKNQISIPGL